MLSYLGNYLINFFSPLAPDNPSPLPLDNPSLFDLLPDELMMEFFSHLNLAQLGTVCCISKKWKRLASDPILWRNAVYRDIAFGNKDWVKYFGEDIIDEEEDEEEELNSLTPQIVEKFKEFHRAYPEKNVRDSLMLVRIPQTLNKRISLESFGMLAKRSFPRSTIGQDYINPEFAKQTIERSYWVIMTTDILPGSRFKSYAIQEEMLANLAKTKLIGYEVPLALEATVCIMSQYFARRKLLFPNLLGMTTYIHCLDVDFRGIHVGVGNFTFKDGLRVTTAFLSNNCSPNIGMAAIFRFNGSLEGPVINELQQ